MASHGQADRAGADGGAVGMMRSPLTHGGSGCRILATLGRVISVRAARPWYNHDCTQKPPHASAQVTLPREAGRKCGAACVYATNEKARVVVGLAASHHASLVTWGALRLRLFLF